MKGNLETACKYSKGCSKYRGYHLSSSFMRVRQRDLKCNKQDTGKALKYPSSGRAHESPKWVWNIHHETLLRTRRTNLPQIITVDITKASAGVIYTLKSPSNSFSCDLKCHHFYFYNRIWFSFVLFCLSNEKLKKKKKNRLPDERWIICIIIKL